jgi:hypothetical protein
MTSRAWEGLNPSLSEWVLRAVSTMGFRRMTPVQASAIPLFMGNKDVVVEVGSNIYTFRCETKCLGCHREWKNIIISNTHSRKVASTRRTYQKTSCRRYYHITYKVLSKLYKFFATK